MTYHTLILLALTSVISFFGASEAFSQTCRVRTSVLNNGCAVYTEVYEYDYVDVKPEFPGGDNSLMDFINSNRVYPPEAYEAGIEGRVTCAFVVQPDGKISNIQILRGVEKSLNREAIRILSSMPGWIPGQKDNHPVPVRVVRCIPFRK